MMDMSLDVLDIVIQSKTHLFFSRGLTLARVSHITRTTIRSIQLSITKASYNQW